MIANFYKTQYGNYRNSVLLVTRNIEHIPQKGNLIVFSGQLFVIDKICFDIDKCEYNLYIVRV